MKNTTPGTYIKKEIKKEMDTKIYELYWREFNYYKGGGLKRKTPSGAWEYGNYSLLKTGYQEKGKDREECNYKYEKVNRWRDLWGEHILHRKVELKLPLKEVKRYETTLSTILQEKDFSLKENVSGISEFRLNNAWRRERIEVFFDLLEKKYGK